METTSIGEQPQQHQLNNVSDLCLYLPHYFSSAALRGQAGNVSTANTSALVESTISDPLLETIKYILAGVINPLLCAFGLVGNVFSVVVLSRRRMQATMNCSTMEKSAYIGLIALAVSDALYCLSALLDAVQSRQQTAFRQDDAIRMYAQLYGLYFQNTFMHTGSWLTVIMAAGRYAAICRPIQARYLLGVRCTLTAVCATFIIWILLQLPIIWTYEVFELECDNEIVYILDVGQFVIHGRLKMAFSYLWSLLGFLLPVLTLIYCNVHLVRALRESYRVRRQYRVNARVATSCGSRVTPTLVAVVCMYLVLITPSELLQFYYYTVRQESVELFNTAIVATNCLLTMNFAFNFVLYCIVNVHFRETWKELVYCTVCRRWREGTPTRHGSIIERQSSGAQFDASFRRHTSAEPNVCLNVNSPMSGKHEYPTRGFHHRHQMMVGGRPSTASFS